MAAIRSMGQRLWCGGRNVASSRLLQSSLTSGRLLPAAAPQTRALSYVTAPSFHWQTALACKKTFCTSANPGDHQFVIVQFEDVKERCLEKNSFLLDVRNPNELAELGKIPGAFNIPVDKMVDAFLNVTDEAFKQKFGFDKPTKEEDMVVYCRSGVRAATACSVLEQAGYPKLFLYKGSWLDWAENNGPQ